MKINWKDLHRMFITSQTQTVPCTISIQTLWSLFSFLIHVLSFPGKHHSSFSESPVCLEHLPLSFLTQVGYPSLKLSQTPKLNLPSSSSIQHSPLIMLNFFFSCVTHAQSLIHAWLFVTLWIVAYQALLSMEFSRQELPRAGCHFLWLFFFAQMQLIAIYGVI